eukprot:scaffold262738_cov16-Prasinocladus_malaysianus.AAC.1
MLTWLPCWHELSFTPDLGFWRPPQARNGVRTSTIPVQYGYQIRPTDDVSPSCARTDPVFLRCELVPETAYSHIAKARGPLG